MRNFLLGLFIGFVVVTFCSTSLSVFESAGEVKGRKHAASWAASCYENSRSVETTMQCYDRYYNLFIKGNINED